MMYNRFFLVLILSGSLRKYNAASMPHVISATYPNCRHEEHALFSKDKLETINVKVGPSRLSQTYHKCLLWCVYSRRCKSVSVAVRCDGEGQSSVQCHIHKRSVAFRGREMFEDVVTDRQWHSDTSNLEHSCINTTHEYDRYCALETYRKRRYLLAPRNRYTANPGADASTLAVSTPNDVTAAITTTNHITTAITTTNHITTAITTNTEWPTILVRGDYYMSRVCSSFGTTVQLSSAISSGTIYGSDHDYTIDISSTSSCTVLFLADSYYKTISVRLERTDFCPDSPNDRLELYDSSHVTGSPDMVIYSGTNQGAQFSTSSYYLTLKLITEKGCWTGSRFYQGFKLTYAVNTSISQGAVVSGVAGAMLILLLGCVGLMKIRRMRQRSAAATSAGGARFRSSSLAVVASTGLDHPPSYDAAVGAAGDRHNPAFAMDAPGYNIAVVPLASTGGKPPSYEVAVGEVEADSGAPATMIGARRASA